MKLQKQTIQELLTQSNLLIQKNQPDQARDLLDTCLVYLAHLSTSLLNPLEKRWIDRMKTKVWGVLEDNNLLLE